MDQPTDTQQQVIDHLRSHGATTAKEAATATGVPYSTLTAMLRRLATAGHVTNNDGMWSAPQASSATPAPAPEPGDDTDPADPDTDEPAEGTSTDEQANSTEEDAAASADDSDDADDSGSEDVDDQLTEEAALSSDLPPATDSEDTSSSDTTGSETPGGEAKRLYQLSGDARLAKGELRGLVLAFLRATPEDEFGPAAIAKALSEQVDRKVSAGAVINACDKLAASGEAVRTQDKPVRIKAA